MDIKIKFGGLAFLLMLLLTTFSAVASDKKEMPAPDDNGEKAQLAMQFVEYGKSSKDANAVLAGVKLMREMAGPVMAPSVDGKTKKYDTVALLKAARNYEPSNKGLVQLLNDEIARTPDGSKGHRWGHRNCYWDYVEVWGYYGYRWRYRWVCY